MFFSRRQKHSLAIAIRRNISASLPPSCEIRYPSRASNTDHIWQYRYFGILKHQYRYTGIDTGIINKGM